MSDRPTFLPEKPYNIDLLYTCTGSPQAPSYTCPLSTPDMYNYNYVGEAKHTPETIINVSKHIYSYKNTIPDLYVYTGLPTGDPDWLNLISCPPPDNVAYEISYNINIGLDNYSDVIPIQYYFTVSQNGFSLNVTDNDIGTRAGINCDSDGNSLSMILQFGANNAIGGIGNIIFYCGSTQCQFDAPFQIELNVFNCNNPPYYPRYELIFGHMGSTCHGSPMAFHSSIIYIQPALPA